MTLTTGLAGQRTLVTASSQGIGYGAAEAFLQEGARVVINGSNTGRLQAAARRLSALGEVHPIVADLARPEDLERLVAETGKLLGGIDTLAYVTGSVPPGPFLEQDYVRWRDAALLLTVGPAYLARLVAERMMKDRTQGRMVFLASFAIREPIPNIALSNVCRVAIAGLVRTLARELGPSGIRVNGILPGYISTDRVRHVFEDAANRTGSTPEKVRTDLERDIPLRRLGTPQELAQTIVFLGSEMSAYVSGAMIPVDGGLLRSVG